MPRGMSATALHAPRPFEVDIDGISMSGLISAVEEPRAVLLAWHGGATSPEYYDSPGHPRHSLMRLGAELGFTVLAPDRPGYGSSRAALGDVVGAERQVELAFDVVDEALRDLPRGAGLSLLGHSQGCVMAMRMAAHDRGSQFIGLEIAGTGVTRSERADSAHTPSCDAGRARGTLRNLLWEPARLYQGREPVLRPPPQFDGADASTWPQEFAALAPRVTVPVRISLGDHEYWWQAPPAGLNAMAAHFTSSPRVVADELFEAGHNTSLGISAFAYHLQVIAFVEQCVLMQSSLGSETTAMETDNA